VAVDAARYDEIGCDYATTRREDPRLHWDDQLEASLRELRRVARGPVVFLTVDADVCADMWLLRDYLPEVAALDRATFPTLARLAEWIGGTVDVETILTARDTPDWTLASFWAHPERVLDETARNTPPGSLGWTQPS
jgi:hypothetical protein